MKLPCAVVRDLLAQYEEGLTGPETRALIEEHLAECEDCRRAREGDAASPPAPVSASDEAAPLKTIGKTIRRRRRLTAWIAALAVLAVAFTVTFRLMREEYAPYSADLVRVSTAKVESLDPGETGLHLYLEYDGGACRIETERVTDPVDGSETLYVQCLRNGLGRNPAAWLTGGDTAGEGRAPDEAATLDVRPIPDRVIYGFSGRQTLLWGEENKSGGAAILPRLALAYYVLIAAGLALVFGLLWLILRRKKAGAVMRQLFFAPAAYLLAHLCLAGLTTVSFSLMADLGCILALTGVLYALATLLWKGIALRRRSGPARGADPSCAPPAEKE